MSCRSFFLHCLIALILTFTGAAFAQPWTEWRNALAPKGEAGPELTLAANGATTYVIVVPEAATTQDQKAAQDLAQWLKELTVAEFPVVNDAQPLKDTFISIGKTKPLVASALPAAQQDLGNEGYVIAAKDKALYLLGGRKRGPINAVYALLEEDLGCRWYAGETARVPKVPVLTFKPVLRSFVPVLEIRDPFYQVAFNGTWSLRNRTNAPSAVVPEEWGGNVDYALFVHTFNTLVPPEQYFAAHPEYFMVDDKGNRSKQQLCTTNPEVINLVTQSVLKTLKEHPNSEIISVSKNDGGGTCLCPNCKAVDDAEGSNAGSLLFLVNRVAEAVEKEYPQVAVSTLAYLETITPPKTVKPRANVAIQLCTDNCMWAHPFTPAEQSEAFSKAMTGWAAICNRIHIWDYCVNFSHYTAPMPNLDVVTANIRYFFAHSAKGIMEQGAYQSPGAERDLLRAWVLAKLMWDPSRDLEALTQDFIWGYFGKAAPALAAYNELLKATGTENAANMKDIPGGIRYGMDAEFLSPKFLARAIELYDQAEALADNPEVAARVQRDRLPIMYVQLSRGPKFVGADYAKLVARFESIAHQVGLTHIAEGAPDLQKHLDAWLNSM